MLNGESILVTGGTGSFGKAFIHTVLERYPEVARIVVYSRDELKQFEMAQRPEFQSKALRFFIGNVRDRRRLSRAMEGIKYVVHAAALKQVPAAEYNPFEAVKTNIMGAQNVIECCLDHDVRRVVALSTDKAAAPINVYGATKLCSDKLFVAANNYKGARDLRFAAVRYGNVMGSRGSVIPFFLKVREQGSLPITDNRMTRFNITLDEGVQLVLEALAKQRGGEIYVPRIPSFRVTDLAAAIAPGLPTREIGIRPGEKLHEALVTASDAVNTVMYDDHLVILPPGGPWDLDEYAKDTGGEPCPADFYYHSDNNTQWLSVEDLRRMITEHIDPSFVPTDAP